jgi:diguanylate cyclase (GGDEF)-like protein/excisionase family DNA binding protein
MTEPLAPAPDDKCLTVSAAARLLGVTAWTLRSWTADGLLSSMRTAGGHRRYRSAELERFAAARAEGNGGLASMRRLAAVGDVSTAILEQPEPSDAVRAVSLKLLQALACSAVRVSLYEPETTGVLDAVHYVSADGSIQTGGDALAHPDVRSLREVPLTYRSEAIGIVELIDKRERHLTQQELQLAQAIANQLSALLYSKRHFDAAERRQRELEALLRIATAVTSAEDVRKVLDVIAETPLQALGVYWCALYSYDATDDLLRLEVHRCIEERDKSEWRLSLMSSAIPAMAHAVHKKTPVSVYADDPDLSPESRLDMQRCGDQAQLYVPMVYRRRVIGLLYLGEVRTLRRFGADDLGLAATIAAQGAAAMETARAHARERKERENVKKLHLANLRALSSALSAKDYYTLGHAGRVAAYMGLLGRDLGWSDERQAQAQDIAFLHDIGKIGVSERVLLKAGPLSSEEWELVRQHPGISAEIVRPLFDEELVAGVRHHHERFDGAGYPDGLSGEQIPEMARAMCVVDSYDAMSCDRPYRRALTYRQCLAELRRCSGAHFDPQIVAAFERTLRRLMRRRAFVADLARQAAALIDPAEHALLRQRDDEQHEGYRRMSAALRALRAAHPSVRYITTFAMADEQCISVLDTGDSEVELSHCGDPWPADDDDLRRLFAGAKLDGNVLSADDFGVWVSGLAPVHDAEGTIVAGVTVDMPAIEGASPSHIDQSRTLASMLQATAMRFSRAEVEAITDGLTGLYNHRYLHERLGEELRRADRLQHRLSLLFCDCDNFKVYNDLYGHKAGDEALARIARHMEAASRRVDLAARYGGEEFVLVLIDTDAAGALNVAGRLCSAIRESSAERGRPLTVSIGVATYPDDAAAKDELLDKADWAMYAAKRAGRNRVLAFSDGLVREETWLSRRGR